MRVRGRSGGCGGGGGGLLHRRLSAADNMGDVCVGDNIGSDGSGIVIGGSVGDVGIVGSGGGVGGGVDSGGGHGFARRGGERQRGQQLLRLPRELRHALADRPRTRHHAPRRHRHQHRRWRGGESGEFRSCLFPSATAPSSVVALTIVAAVATTLARKGIVREKEPLGLGLLLLPALLAPLPCCWFCC
jgi:hypothetical protein